MHSILVSAFICICIHFPALLRIPFALRCPFRLFCLFAASPGGKRFLLLAAARAPACLLVLDGREPVVSPGLAACPSGKRVSPPGAAFLRKLGQAANLPHCPVEPPASSPCITLHCPSISTSTHNTSMHSISIQALALSSISIQALAPKHQDLQALASTHLKH